MENFLHRPWHLFQPHIKQAGKHSEFKVLQGRRGNLSFQLSLSTSMLLVLPCISSLICCLWRPFPPGCIRHTVSPGAPPSQWICGVYFEWGLLYLGIPFVGLVSCLSLPILNLQKPFMEISQCSFYMGTFALARPNNCRNTIKQNVRNV